MVVNCTVTTEGTVRDCQILRGIPELNESVLHALERHHGSPATFEGRPVAVRYTYTLTFNGGTATPSH